LVTTLPGGVSCVNISSAAVIARGGRTDSVAAGEAEMISVGTPRDSISRGMEIGQQRIFLDAAE